MITATLYVTYNHKPTTPVFAAPSPASGGSYHALAIGFGASSTDADGDAVRYLFEAATDAGFVNKFFSYGWSTSLPAPMWLDGSYAGKTIYWHAYAHDGLFQTAASPTYSLTIIDTASTLTGLVPAMTQGKAPVISTTTPILTAVGGGDADAGAVVEYNFTISGGSDTVNGKASSGWQSGSSWTVPSGVLEEGQQYSWSVSVRENANGGKWPVKTLSSVLKVDRRMGSGGPAPSDSLGGASVNLANGNLFLSASGHGVSSVGGSLAVGVTYNAQLATVMVWWVRTIRRRTGTG